MKIVINDTYGGFGLSSKAILYLIEHNSTLVNKVTYEAYGLEPDDEEAMEHFNEQYDIARWSTALCDHEQRLVYTIDFNPLGDNMDYQDWDLAQIRQRTHPDIIHVVEELGDEANGPYARLKIVNIDDPDIDETKILVKEYDGSEWVAEKHRTWS